MVWSILQHLTRMALTCQVEYQPIWILWVGMLWPKNWGAGLNFTYIQHLTMHVKYWSTSRHLTRMALMCQVQIITLLNMSVNIVIRKTGGPDWILHQNWFLGRNVWIHDVTVWNQDDCIAVKVDQRQHNALWWHIVPKFDFSQSRPEAFSSFRMTLGTCSLKESVLVG